MKHLLFILVASALFLAFAQRGSAQFIPATVAEDNTDAGNIAWAENTGNDVKVDGSDVMKVHVWDGSPGIGWDFFDGTTHTMGFTTLAAETMDPDVILQLDNGDWYAVVARASMNDGGIYMDVYWWNSGAFQPVNGATNQLISGNTGAFASAVNIDGDPTGNFVIIWDDANTSDIQLIGGTTNSGIPMLSNAGPQSIPDTDNGEMGPDVALFTNYQNDVLVNYSYLDASLSELNVGTDDFGDLLSGNVTHATNYADVITDVFDHPRIATPATIDGPEDPSLNHWTVVSGTNGANGGDIVGYTYMLDQNTVATVNIFNYTDGSVDLDLGAITGYNRFPAVSYCN